MTKITVLKNKENEYVGFDAVGHSGYSIEGDDIICSAISMLVINAINSIDAFTDDDFTVNSKEEGTIYFKLNCIPSLQTTLLLDSMVLGLQSIEDNKDYENYIDIIFEEV